MLFADKTKTKAMGSVGHRYATDGNVSVRLICNNPDGSRDIATIWVGYDAAGNVRTYAPTPPEADNSTQIATTNWVRNCAAVKSGNRDALAGYETPLVQATALTIDAGSRDTNLVTGAVTITVANGAANTCWTKTVALTNASAKLSMGTAWKWQGGEAPTISANCVVVLHWISTFGVASLIHTTE